MRSVPQSSLTLFDGKVCSKCGFWVPLTDFIRAKQNKSGIGSWCKPCNRPIQGLISARFRARKQEQARQRKAAEPKPTGKTCITCGIWKSFSEFPKNRSNRGGVGSYCKPCDRARGRAYVKEHREKTTERSRQWFKVHPDKVLARSRSRHEYMKQALHKRRAWKEGNGGTYTTQEWQDLKARYDNRCLRCGVHDTQSPLTVDHVIPISRGGTNDISNLQPLCKSCNSSKNAKHIDYRT